MRPLRSRPTAIAVTGCVGILTCGGIASAAMAMKGPKPQTPAVSHQSHQVKKPVRPAAGNGRRVTPRIPSRAMVSFTFDDGKKNQFRYAMPILDRARLKGSFYVIGGAVDDWPEYRADYMTAAEIKTLSKKHEVGNHTWNHGNLLELTKGKSGSEAEKALKAEFSRAQDKLAKVTGVRPKTCAYPYGAVNSAVSKIAKQYFAACRTTSSGLNSPGDDLTKLKIFYMTSKTTTAQLEKALANAKRENKWIILCYHSVKETDSPKDEYDVTVANFTKQVQAVKKSGVPVATMSQALGLG
jgi:peptidoglycan/xylan/chitin deacetylase (PgdA/CDA1 family)